MFDPICASLACKIRPKLSQHKNIQSQRQDLQVELQVDETVPTSS